jgi:hypothetical protein
MPIEHWLTTEHDQKGENGWFLLICATTIQSPFNTSTTISVLPIRLLMKVAKESRENMVRQ